MKFIKLFLIIMFIPSLIPAAVPSALAITGLDLSSESSKIQSGEETIVEVRVKDMPPVYGTEFALSFDPDVLEVVDSDTQAEGVQIAPGGFFDLSKSHFPLQNHVDNSKGSVRYAVSMLNPAPSAQGNGAVAKIAFRAKSPGQAGVRVEASTFGTRNGEAIVPDLRNKLAFQILEDKAPFSRSLPLIGVAAILLSILLMAIFRKTSLAQK